MTLKEALINQGSTITEAEEIIEQMVESVNKGNDPENVLDEYCLEPDYVMDLLEKCL